MLCVVLYYEIINKGKKGFEKMNEKIRDVLVELRERKSLTQTELAQKMSKTQALISRIEAGKTNPTIRTLEGIASATDTELVIQFIDKDV